MYKARLSHYPQPRYVIYHSGNKFKLHVAMISNQFGIECKLSTAKNPQPNAILAAAGVEGKSDFDPTGVEQLIIDASWAVCSTLNTIVSIFPGAAVFRCYAV